MKKKCKSKFQQLVDQHLQIALKEIGAIKPWFDQDIQEWVFEHKLYPESFSGATRQEVRRRYPLYLRQFIEQRLKNNLVPWIERKTIGRGGWRPGAGRPKGSTKAPTRCVRLPADIAQWIKADPNHLDEVRHLMNV